MICCEFNPKCSNDSKKSNAEEFEITAEGTKAKAEGEKATAEGGKVFVELIGSVLKAKAKAKASWIPSLG